MVAFRVYWAVICEKLPKRSPSVRIREVELTGGNWVDDELEEDWDDEEIVPEDDFTLDGGDELGLLVPTLA